MLWSVWCRKFVLDAFRYKKTIQGVVLDFDTIVSFQSSKWIAYPNFYVVNEVNQLISGFRFVSHKVYPSKFGMIINNHKDVFLNN